MKNFIKFSIFLLSLFLLVSCSSKKEKCEKLYLSAVDDYANFNFENAKLLCDKVLDLNKNFYQADFLKAKILFFQEEYENSEKIFSKLTKKFPEFVDARIWLIRVQIVLGKNIEAKKNLDKELKFNSTDWRIFYLYSLVYKAEKLLDKEINMLINAENALKDSAKVYSSLAFDWKILGLEEKEKEYHKKSEIIGSFK